MVTERHHVTDSKFVPLVESAYLKVASDLFLFNIKALTRSKPSEFPQGSMTSFRSCEDVHVNYSRNLVPTLPRTPTILLDSLDAKVFNKLRRSTIFVG